MKTLQFTKEIKAPAQKVGDMLWNETTYPQWTDAFSKFLKKYDYAKI